MKPFGESDVAVRSLSGVISVATLPVAWVVGRRFVGQRAAWVLVVVLASAPFAVYYGTEARMYSLVMLLTACACRHSAEPWSGPTGQPHRPGRRGRASCTPSTGRSTWWGHSGCG